LKSEISEDLLLYKLSQSEQIWASSFAAKRGPEIFWMLEPLGPSNTKLLSIKQYGEQSILFINLTLLICIF
jgi:hypothetical protein